MKRIIFLLILLLGISFADMIVGNAYIISAIGIKNAEGNVVYQSGDSNALSNGTYKLAPQVIIYDGKSYVGASTPFSGCIGDKHYANGVPSGSCFTGGLATAKQDGLMSKEDKIKLDKVSDRTTKSNYLDTTGWYISEANTVDWTRNEDGTFSVTGNVTANGVEDRSLILLYEGENNFAGMKFLGNPLQGNPNCWLHVDYVTNDNKWIIDEKDIEGDLIIDESPKIRLYIWIKKELGQELNNLTFKPMLTDNLDATIEDYIPFEESLVIGGNVGLKMDLLWVNGHQDLAFPAQKVTIENIVGYRWLLIRTLSLANIPTYYTNFAFNSSEKQILYAPYTNEGQGTIVTGRNFNVVRDGIVFETATTFSVQDGIVGGDDNQPQYCVPVAIYGIK